MQEVKFVRYTVQDPRNPTVQITLPANGTHVSAGSQVVFTSTSSDLDSGLSLPGIDLSWEATGSYLGNGANITRVFTGTGTYTIKLTGTNALGKSASASITIVVDPAPPAASVQIVSSANGASYIVGNSTTYSVSLVASGSPGMQFTWSSSIDGDLGSGANITANLTVQHQGNCAPPTTHTITLHGQDNLGRTASASITITLNPTCVK